MKCPECQLEVLEDSNFCKSCGHHFTEDGPLPEVHEGTEGERKHVTIMFSDLSGYTAMTDKLDPEEARDNISMIIGEIAEINFPYDHGRNIVVIMIQSRILNKGETWTG